MSLEQLQRTWNDLGEQDPLWAILSHRDKRGNRWELGDFLATGRDEIAGVLEHAEARRPGLRRGRALDFGCGVGRLTQALGDHFQEVHGVDVAPSMIERARELDRHGGRCIYHLNERADLEMFASGEFDFVYSKITLQHMERRLQDGYIRELCRVLAPGGMLMFQLPGAGRASARVWTWLRPPLRAAYLFYHRSLRGRPIMDMFGSPPARVRELVRSAGAEVWDVQQDDSAGPDWESFIYSVGKDV